MLEQEKIVAVIGLGYVGLPLAVEFGKIRPTIGFDINPERIRELERGEDHTLETSSEDLKAARHLRLTFDEAELKEARLFIVAVPTPVDRNKRPDLTPLIRSSELVARALKPGDIVIYESTVYPGATEEECVPILEKGSGLTYNRDFYCGYSPERINPGDKVHTLTTIKKVTSGSTPAVADEVDALYRQIIKAGTHKASSIRVAEAAKVIENSQRDINIAFVNELAILFAKLGIDTIEVLEAAGTKWNFLPFRPGLVGGHCIGVDPYYLTHKAQEIGHNPEIILAGRRLNDNMGFYVAQEVIKLMIKKGQKIQDARVLVLGITFKENCPDIRNSRVIDVIQELSDFGCRVEVFDPWANAEHVRHEYHVQMIDLPRLQEPILGLPADIDQDKRLIDGYQAVILAVAHAQFLHYRYACAGNGECVIYDIKGILPKEMVHGRL